MTDGISEYVDDLKKGKSRVLERGHTLILGWSDKACILLFYTRMDRFNFLPMMPDA